MNSNRIIALAVVLLLIPFVSFSPSASFQVAGNPSRTNTVYLPIVKNKHFNPIKVPVLLLTFFPPDPTNPALLDPVETGWTGVQISDMQVAVQRQVASGLAFLKDATRFRGYQNPLAPSYLEYFIHSELEFMTIMPRGYQLPWGPYRPHYNQILRSIGICNFVDGAGVKEVWIFGYHSQVIEPDESKMSSKYGDISNAWPKDEWIPKKFHLPKCLNSYVMYNPTYQISGVGAGEHNRMHQLENVIFYAENRGYPVNPTNAKGSLFWDDFSVYGTANTFPGYKASCGNTHSPPNTTNEYDYTSKQYRLNNCESWHPDDSLTTYSFENCDQWGCTDLGFYKWFMQSVPGKDNEILYQGKAMRNWWEAMHDFDQFIDDGRTLFR